MRNHNEGQSPPAKQHADKSAQRRPKLIAGAGTQENIKVVRIKLVSVFAAKFLPDLDTEMLSILSLIVTSTVNILSLQATDTTHLMCAMQ